MSFAPMWTVNSDGQKCANFDPVRGKEIGRSLQVSHSLARDVCEVCGMLSMAQIVLARNAPT